MKEIDFHGFEPDPSRDQHFLKDAGIIKKMISLVSPKKKDSILEIGAGIGTITAPLAETGAKVTAVELDRRTERILGRLKYPNLRVVHGNALDVMDGVEFNKLISSTPYSICEALLNNLTRKDFDKAVLSIPKKFYGTISAREGDKYSELSMLSEMFFDIRFCFPIPLRAFAPVPDTETVVVSLKHRKDGFYRKSPHLYVMKWVFLLDRKKIGNSLREGIIKYGENIAGQTVTKREAVKMVSGLSLSKKLLEKRPKQAGLKGLEKVKASLKDFSCRLPPRAR